MSIAAIPHGRTARRLEWPFLPPQVRALVEDRLGSPVAHAASQGGGFTPGFASVLTGRDGSRIFVKAASCKAQRAVAASYRDEARQLDALPADVPAPRLLWTHEDDAWVVLGIEHVEAASPQRPWRVADLDRCLDTLEALADTLSPAPPGPGRDTFADAFADFLAAWDHVRRALPDLPHLQEAATLAGRYAEVCAGDTLVHTDVRDDNLLLGPAGEVWVCDWNWPVLGAPWLDTVFLLLGARGDGIDVEALLRERRLTRDLPREHVDVVLALLAGYFLRQRDAPAPPSSPWLRTHQSWCAEVAWGWLGERRGWL